MLWMSAACGIIGPIPAGAAVWTAAQPLAKALLHELAFEEQAAMGRALISAHLGADEADVT
jgi:hypothetical protein